MAEDVVEDVDRTRVDHLVPLLLGVLSGGHLPRLCDLERNADELDRHDHHDGVGVRRRRRQTHVVARPEEYQVGELREETEGVEPGGGDDGDEEDLRRYAVLSVSIVNFMRSFLFLPNTAQMTRNTREQWLTSLQGKRCEAMEAVEPGHKEDDGEADRG